MSRRRQKKNKLWFYLIGILVIGAIFVWSRVDYQRSYQDELKVVFCDVGQGDAILIEFGENNQVLIDGGPSKQVLSCLGKHLPYSDRKIEYVILTHPDTDHLAGLLSVIKQYQIGKLYQSDVDHATQLYRKFKALIKEKQIKTKPAYKGEIIKFQNQPEAKLKIIYPARKSVAFQSDNLNNSSVVSLLDFGRIELLLTGDAEKEVWQEIRNQLPKVEILKVSHHGSSNGTDETLLEQVKPEVAVISVGEDNRYGHPTAEVMNLLDQYRIETYRTDQEGNVEILINKNEYIID